MATDVGISVERSRVNQALVGFQVSSGGIVNAASGDQVQVHHHHYARTASSFPSRISNFQAIHSDNLSKATSGTGRRFQDTPECGMWLEPRGHLKVVWGFGIPGAGKTTLTAVFIHSMQISAASFPSPIGVAYLYFRYTDHAQTTVRDCLEVFVKQIVEQHAGCRPDFDLVYTSHNRENSQPSETELLYLLGRFAELICAIFLFIDALDEAPTAIQLHLIQKIASINVKLFVTSRPGTGENHFPNAFQFEIYAQDHDLDLHIAEETSKSLELQEVFRTAEDAWREKIVTVIKQKCDKMFLHASLQLNALRECTNVHEVEKTLEEIPYGIEAFYVWTWKRILGQELKKALLAQKVLWWTLHATRLLTYEELGYAIAMAPDTHQFEGDRVVPMALLVSVCRGLVVIEEKTKLVRLVHETAKVIMEKLTLERDPNLHAHLAETCIGHLTNCGFQHTKLESEDALTESLTTKPLLQYAFDSWIIHAHKALDRGQAVEGLANFVRGCHALPALLGPDRLFDVLGPLHVVAYANLSLLTLANSSDLEDLNIPSQQRGLTPLIVTAIQDSQTTMRELLEMPSILVNSPGHQTKTPLIMVAEAGKDGAAKLLLGHKKIKVHLADENGRTAFAAAVECGCEGVAELILAHPKFKVNQADPYGRTALIVASRKGKERIVRLLLDHHQTKLNVADMDGMTALKMALFYGHRGTFDLLAAHPRIKLDTTAGARDSEWYRRRHPFMEYVVSIAKNLKLKFGWKREENGGFVGDLGDLVVLLIGPPGAGRSTFVKEYTGSGDDSGKISMGFYCGTGDVTAHLVAVPQTFAQHFGGRRLVLVDTPAIDRISNNNRDPGALGVIRSWLERSYHKHPPIVGIIYMYDISPTWVPRARIVFEHVANKICGSFEPLKNIVLATSHWDSLDDENTGVQKEHEIRGMLQEFTGRGLSFIPIRKKPVDQYAIIDYLLRTFIDRGSTHGSLQIQKEMLSRRQNPETQAAPSIIILLGTTGSGKSTFVNACIPDARAVSSRSGTTNVTFFSAEGFILVDTPGLHSIWRDGSIVQEIVDCMAREFSDSIRRGAPCGVIFVQSEDEHTQDSGPVLRDLRSAFKRRTGSTHELLTPARDIAYMSYNGTIYSKISQDLQAFCQDRIGEALNDGLSVQDVLDELQQVRVRHSARQKEPGWWEGF